MNFFDRFILYLLFEDFCMTIMFVYKKWLKWIILKKIYFESVFIKPNNFYIKIYNINLSKKFMK